MMIQLLGLAAIVLLASACNKKPEKTMVSSEIKRDLCTPPDEYVTVDDLKKVELTSGHNYAAKLQMTAQVYCDGVRNGFQKLALQSRSNNEAPSFIQDRCNQSTISANDLWKVANEWSLKKRDDLSRLAYCEAIRINPENYNSYAFLAMVADHSNPQIIYSLLQGVMDHPKAVDDLKRNIDRTDPGLVRSLSFDRSPTYLNARFALATVLRNLTHVDDTLSGEDRNKNYMRAIQLFDEVYSKVVRQSNMQDLEVASSIKAARAYTWLHHSTNEELKSYQKEALRRFERTREKLDSSEEEILENSKVRDSLDSSLGFVNSSAQARVWILQHIIQIRELLVSLEQFTNDSEKKQHWGELASAYNALLSRTNDPDPKTLLNAGIANFEAGELQRAITHFKQVFNRRSNCDKFLLGRIYYITALFDSGDLRRDAVNAYRSLIKCPDFQNLLTFDERSKERSLAMQLQLKAK